MKLTKENTLILLSSMILLSGCQQPSATIKAPPLVTQVQQISSLIASSEYLRHQCNRSDLPSKTQLQNAAMRMAQQKGWDTKAPEYQQLDTLSNNRYQGLLKDGTPMAQQCSQFNISLAPLIETARQR